jgi:P4 family phage/plasmid primase-like protien
VITVSFCFNVKNSRFVDDQIVFNTFGDFLEDIREGFVEAEHKEELPLFSLAEYSAPGARRCNQNVLRLHGLVLDVDKGSIDDLVRLQSTVEGYGHFSYTTFSHDPAVQAKMRFVLKVSRPVGIGEWASFWIRAVDFFQCLPLLDKSGCKDPARMFYISGGDPSKYICGGKDGPALDVDKILARTLPSGVEEPALDTFEEVLPEEARGEITPMLREYWWARLSNFCDEVRKRPYPGEAYDLKNHEVFAIARGIPHIIDKDKVERFIYAAHNRRYDKAAALGHDVEVHRHDAHAKIAKAIAEGMDKPWYPPAVEDIEGRPLTEIGLAERLVDQHGEDLGWVSEWQKWSVWTGKHWDTASGNELADGKMIEVIRKIPEESEAFEADRWEAKEHFESVENDPNVSAQTKGIAETKLKAIEAQMAQIQKFAIKSETAGKIAAGVKIARSSPVVLRHYEIYDQHPYVLNFRNGTVDLRDPGKLRPHRRSDYITKMINHDYDPKAVCPTVDRFIDEIMLGRKRLADFVWRLAGYTALGITSEQILIMCIGDGANGKSTLMNLFLDAFGQGVNGYGFSANSENLLTANGGGRHETWRMSMQAKRIVVCQEVAEGRTFNESLIKELTGSDVITGRKMRQDEWSFTPEFQLWLCANHMPHVRGTDEGIWRRLMVLPFDASFKGRKDPHMPDKLRREIPGFLARVVREAALYLQEGLQVPREVRVASEQYRREEDPLRPFLERYCAIERQEMVQPATLWAAYEKYAEESRNRVFHKRKVFFGAVEKRFKIHKRKGVRGFLGLRLLNHEERLARTPEIVLQRAEHDAKEREKAEAEKAESVPSSDGNKVVPLPKKSK